VFFEHPGFIFLRLVTGKASGLRINYQTAIGLLLDWYWSGIGLLLAV